MFSSLGFCFRLKKPNPKISKLTIEKVCSIDDLLIQILVHLPLKPLFRFKSVSKHWNSIISDPKFQLMHNQLLQAHRNNRAAADLIIQIHYRNSMRRFVVSLDRSSSSNDSNPRTQMHNIPHNLTILHSCNGLLVLRTTEAPTHDQEHDYYVYNPTTNKKTTTPLLKDEIQARRPRDKVVGMYLAFDPSKSFHYKVVCAWQLDWKTSHTLRCQFDVYSSETGSWKRGRHVHAGSVDLFDGVYWNGAIHWLSGFGNSSIYFNPDHHHHDGMPRVMPTPPIHYPSFDYFGKSCDHLIYVVVGIGDDRSGELFVYEMRRDYSEWYLKYKVDEYSQYLLNSYPVQCLFCVDSFLVLGNGKGEILCYNLVYKTCETVKVKAKAFFYFKTKLFPYIESPCSV